MGSAIDLFVAYRFIRILTTPFEKTDAFKLQNLVNNNTMKTELSEQVPEHMQYLYTTTVQNE